MKTEQDAGDNMKAEQGIESTIYNNEEPCGKVEKKQFSNLSVVDMLVDRWYRFLEQTFAPDCYYIGRNVSKILSKGMRNLSSSSRFVICNEKKPVSFGVDVNVLFIPGKIFSEAVVVVPVWWGKLYFFRPIQVEGGPVKIAIGKRSFVEGDTIVLDGTEWTGDNSGYSLNLPSHIVAALRSLRFVNNSEGEKAICDSLSMPSTRGFSVVSCAFTLKGDGTVELVVKCTPKLSIVLPDIVVVANQEKNEMTKIGYAKRFCVGYIITRGLKTAVLGREIVLAEGESVLNLPLDEAKNVARALKAFDETVSMVPLLPSRGLDEMFCGEDALYLRWHRDWTIGASHDYNLEMKEI